LEIHKASIEDRPVSNVNLVRHLDLRKAKSRYSELESLSSFQVNDDSAELYYRGTAWKMEDLSPEESSQDMHTFAGNHLGFRTAALRRTARNLLFQSRRGSTKSSTDSKEKGESSKRPSLSDSITNMSFNPYTTSAATAENEVTVEGYIIPAKRKKTSTGRRLSKRRSVAVEGEEKLEEQDVADVKVGVSITEETADLHTPDVILSV
jgi:hypothetical protein